MRHRVAWTAMHRVRGTKDTSAQRRARPSMQPPRPDSKQRTPRNEGRDKVENDGSPCRSHRRDRALRPRTRNARGNALKSAARSPGADTPWPSSNGRKRRLETGGLAAPESQKRAGARRYGRHPKVFICDPCAPNNTPAAHKDPSNTAARRNQHAVHRHWATAARLALTA